MTTLLEVDDVHHSYGSTQALKGVSFAVSEGEMFGLLGPNGAGKSTLMAILAGLRAPTRGGVRFSGEPLHPGNRAVKCRIGLVPQELALYPELTAAENLRFFAALYRLPSAEIERRVTRILDMIGLSDRADDRAGTFSGGMQRRLNLGIALVHEPTLILLDEPTAGVDPQSRNHLFEGIRKLNAAGIAIIYTSHYMEEVQALCPRIGIIDHGKLIACDLLSNLLARLPGRIRFALAAPPSSWDGLAVQPFDSNWLLTCSDMPAAIVELIAWCGVRKLTITKLETETPNLERVFLHLTGQALRD